jgi:hypothetical protein
MDFFCDDAQQESERHHRQFEKENDKGIVEDLLAEYRVLAGGKILAARLLLPSNAATLHKIHLQVPLWPPPRNRP